MSSTNTTAAQSTTTPNSSGTTVPSEGGVVFKQNLSEFVQVNQKVFFAAADRNKDAIYEQIKPFLNKTSLVLEVGSGSGQHISHFAKDFPQVFFQPTEYDTNLHASIQAYANDLPNHRILPPLELNATNEAHWGEALRAGHSALQVSGSENGPVYDLVLTTNVFHIAPWIVTESTVKGANRLLKPGGFFIVYGPFKRHGQFNTESNREFDATLRGRDPTWGVRDLDDIQAVAEKETQLRLKDVRDMPANNYLVIFEKI
ncbi:hypothetical protein BGW41_003613 [Actinomortierella wolfii]|nr:hypothetical protein BGW41_003613 [Actinomortierella wolfii]